MSKIIFIDVDGTLVDYEGNLPRSAAEAIGAARKNGHRVYISTGRSKAEVYLGYRLGWNDRRQRELCGGPWECGDASADYKGADTADRGLAS